MAHFGTVDNYDGSEGNTNSSPLKIRKRSWFYTWNNPPNDYVNILTQFMKNFKVDKFVYQLERGENGNIHVQGCLSFKNARYPKFQKNLSEKIHWEFCKNFKRAVLYCCKLDTRIEGPYTNIKNLSFRKTIENPLKKVKLYEWQIFLENLYSCKPDDRKIFWFWENKGNSGKSSFCKYMRLKYGKSVYIIGGTSKDTFHGIQKRLIEEKTELKMIFVDITRSSYNSVSYNALESLKNGYFYSSKYDSSEILMNTVHIVCFCNYKPDITKLSQDRWEIVEIEKF